MGFFERLDAVRARPERDRERLALWLALAITAAITVVWVLNLKLLWGTTDDAPVPNQEGAAEEPAADRLGKFIEDSKIRITRGWQKITNQQ